MNLPDHRTLKKILGEAYPSGPGEASLTGLAPALAQRVLEQHDHINQLIEALHDQSVRHDIQVNQLREALLRLCMLTQPPDKPHAELTPLHEAHAEAARVLALLNRVV